MNHFQVILSLVGSFITFVYYDGFELLLNTQMEIKLKKWEYLKKIFCGNTDKLKQFKKCVIILLPIIYSILDSYSDANYCFGIATGEGIFDLGEPDDYQLIWQKIMLCFLFIGNL